MRAHPAAARPGRPGSAEPRPRVTPSQATRQVLALAWRSIAQLRHNPYELFDYSVQPVLFLLMFTYVFGGALAGSPREYLTFVLPGLLVQNALATTLNTGLGLNTDLTTGLFDRLRSLPIARFTPLAGRILADVGKQVWAFCLVLGLGTVLGFRVETGPVEVVAACCLLLAVYVSVCWGVVLLAMVVSTPERVNVYAFAIILPLIFTSGVFVDTATMPGPLRTFADLNPVTPLSNALRGLLVSGPVATPALYSLAYALGLTALFAPLAVRAFRRRT